MILIGLNGNQTDLLKVKGVKSICCSLFEKEIKIRLSCKKGDEQNTAKNLPQWIINDMGIEQYDGYICLTSER